ncbi:hypothetical protein [Streptomyces sp. NPDC048663]|uniref:hypothetical protein n=1 Tax=Streptomyces sp. NPDC048663 TaxID=3155638 RepID=UPI003424A7ED
MAQAQPAVGEADGVADRRGALLARLADPPLTGLSGPQLTALRAELAPLQAARAQERYSEQRGGRARRATGKLRGSKPLFDGAARVMLTLLYQRQVCSMKLLSDMLEVTPECVGHLVAETRRVLEDHGHQPGYAPTRFTTAAELLAFLDTSAVWLSSCRRAAFRQQFGRHPPASVVHENGQHRRGGRQVAVDRATAAWAKALATGGGRSGRRAVADRGRVPPVLVDNGSPGRQAPPGAVNKCCSKS